MPSCSGPGRAATGPGRGWPVAKQERPGEPVPDGGGAVLQWTWASGDGPRPWVAGGRAGTSSGAAAGESVPEGSGAILQWTWACGDGPRPRPWVAGGHAGTASGAAAGEPVSLPDLESTPQSVPSSAPLRVPESALH